MTWLNDQLKSISIIALFSGASAVLGGLWTVYVFEQNKMIALTEAMRKAQFEAFQQTIALAIELSRDTRQQVDDSQRPSKRVAFIALANGPIRLYGDDRVIQAVGEYSSILTCVATSLNETKGKVPCTFLSHPVGSDEVRNYLGALSNLHAPISTAMREQLRQVGRGKEIF